MGELGTGNVGITGTYYLAQEGVIVPGASGPTGAVVDVLYDTTVNAGRGLVIDGVALRPRMKYRARAGWVTGPWNVTGFMDYESHFYHAQNSPPNVNSNCKTAGGTTGGGTLPCLIDDYTNIVPSYYTFDLSFGYDTGELPANTYLRDISIQLIVQNITDRVSPYEYRLSGPGGNSCACDVLKSPYGRRVQIRMAKTW